MLSHVQFAYLRVRPNITRNIYTEFTHNIYIFLHPRYWFMHDDSTCQLLYYNSANDDSPRGKIDISIATFKFVPENAKHGEFTISR